MENFQYSRSCAIIRGKSRVRVIFMKETNIVFMKKEV